MPIEQVKKTPPASDLVWGARAIGKAINRPYWSVTRMLEKGRLPARKVGGLWVASKIALREAVTGKQETVATK